MSSILTVWFSTKKSDHNASFNEIYFISTFKKCLAKLYSEMNIIVYCYKSAFFAVRIAVIKTEN